MLDKKIYAYDFFDTVVHRNCHPEKILFQWSRQVSLFLNFIISPGDLYSLRKKTEKELKAVNGIEEAKYEKLIRNIYEKLENINISFVDFYTYCYRCELNVELSHLYLDKNCIQEIIDCKEAGKKIILISDFYLGKTFIQSILKKLKVEEYFSEIFVSSDLNKRKSTGSLYKYVLEYFKIDPDELFMQGDNYRSDVLIPQQLKIYSNHRKYENPYDVMDIKKIERETKRILFSNADENALSGYAGEMVYFISTLYKELCQAGVEKVLFCSREGQLLKKLFDIYQVKTWGKVRIESLYFYVSRKATILPSLGEFNLEKFDMIFRQFENLKIKDFLKSIGFDENEIIQICDEIKVFPEEEFSIDNETIVYKRLLLNRNFLHMYDTKRDMQKALFCRYLKELGYSLENEKITIVDIGWKGTIQDCIQRCLPEGCIVEGYYLGLRTSEFGCINSDLKHGLLFTDYPKKCKNYTMFEHGYMFYERIFSADHGPVLGYRLENEKVVPIINNAPEEMVLYNYIKPYQDNLSAAFEKILALFLDSQWEAYELYDLMAHNFLWKQCVYFPKIWKIEKKARDKSRENFGDISKNEKLKKERVGSEQLKKVDFLFVDYTFRLLEKFHLNIFAPLGEAYCRIVYLIKRIGLK